MAIDQKKLDGFFKDIKKTTGAVSFLESKYGEITHFIDTGCMALNRIVSGSLYKGIPAGRVITISGESATAKSYVAAQTAANALNICKYDAVFYFDSEGGALKDFFKNAGCDLEKLKHILVENIEDACVKIIRVYKLIEEFKESNPDFKALLILDSLGALVAEKIFDDAVSKNKKVADQGQLTRAKNDLVKSCTIPALKTDCSIIITNHVYEGPGMDLSKIKTTSGGKGKEYQASVCIQTVKSLERNEDKKADEAYVGTYIRFMVTKNRIVRPFVETEAYIDFKKGLSKTKGLFELALKYNIVKQSGAWYEVEGYEKKLRQEEIVTNKDIWMSILPKIDAASIKDLAYSSAQECEEINTKIEESIEKQISGDINTETIPVLDTTTVSSITSSEEKSQDTIK